MVFRTIDQNTACNSGSMPSNPNKACGRNQSSPNNPSSKICADITASGPNDGRNIVNAHVTNPMLNPAAAPTRVAPRQKIPPNIAGKTCATPANEINPISASAAEPPDRRK